ncbi:MAG: septal ring lytic transglycosylase RlpA family protein [Verrucomicrobiales bacterium]|nr:septal ring lytic transglycosylase RlpA family protein [Verrucomicrobiales bacterium]MCP5559233.1 septal ring lytic transglycosylase RlpA family protein [Verrucomicrobiaceae bacterium]
MPRFQKLIKVVACLFLASCSTSRQVNHASNGPRWQTYQTGVASWYGSARSRERLACGGRYCATQYAAAHRKLPFGSQVRVTNLNNGRSCVVLINDRGPFVRGRVIDVTWIAARDLGLLTSGVAKVKIELPEG